MSSPRQPGSLLLTKVGFCLSGLTLLCVAGFFLCRCDFSLSLPLLGIDLLLSAAAAITNGSSFFRERRRAVKVLVGCLALMSLGVLSTGIYTLWMLNRNGLGRWP